jgi:hypothetical protein
MTQFALALEPGLATRYANLRECFAHCVYQRGLGRVAADLDVAPSNLSAMLSGDRALPSDLVELYIERFKDPMPARYLAARWLQDPMMLQAAAMAAIPDAVAQLANLMQAAGLQVPKAGRRA